MRSVSYTVLWQEQAEAWGATTGEGSLSSDFDPQIKTSNSM